MAEAMINEFCFLSVVLRSFHMMKKLKTQRYCNFPLEQLICTKNKKLAVQITVVKLGGTGSIIL